MLINLIIIILTSLFEVCVIQMCIQWLYITTLMDGFLEDLLVGVFLFLFFFFVCFVFWKWVAALRSEEIGPSPWRRQEYCVSGEIFFWGGCLWKRFQYWDLKKSPSRQDKNSFWDGVKGGLDLVFVVFCSVRIV